MIVENFLLVIRRGTEILIKENGERKRKRKRIKEIEKKERMVVTAISVSAHTLPMQIYLNVPLP